MQVGFKKTLTKEVAAFAQDAKSFRADWQVNGPMVPGLAPLEAVERLKKFQQMFDVRPLVCTCIALAQVLKVLYHGACTRLIIR